MDAAQLLDILGNRNRRRILQLLSHRPHYVSEISERLGVGPKAVIDHLSLLEDADLVEFYTDNQRRKYFRITDNIQLEVSVSPYSYGVESYSIAIGTNERRPPRWRYDFKSTLTDLSGELQKLESLRQESMLTQRSSQAMITELMSMCAEMVDQMASDSLEAEILLCLIRGGRTPESLSEELCISTYKIEKTLHRLKEKGITDQKEEKWYIK
jgi:ArsR family transcriptional regulator